MFSKQFLINMLLGCNEYAYFRNRKKLEKAIQQNKNEIAKMTEKMQKLNQGIKKCSICVATRILLCHFVVKVFQ